MRSVKISIKNINRMHTVHSIGQNLCYYTDTEEKSLFKFLSEYLVHGYFMSDLSIEFKG